MISVIIPVLEINYYIIFENLPAFEKQSYTDFEVIVLPNQHTQYDVTLLQKYPWLRIIPTGKITRPAEKRDIGVKESKGDVIAFIDDDAYPTPDWLEKASTYFPRSEEGHLRGVLAADVRGKIVALGGPGILPPNANDWEKAFDEVFKTWVGSGGYSYRFIKGKKQFVDDYPSVNFFIRKDVFQEVGGFNSEYWPGEDSKLCEDIVYKLKAKIQYDPNVLVYHHRRTEPSKYFKQHGNYGYHRGAFFAHGDKNSRRLTYLIPTFFVLYLTTLLPFIFQTSYALYVTRYTFIYFIPFLLYLFFCLYLFLKALINTHSLKIALLAPMILFLTHIRYGTMFVKGFFVGMRNKEKIYGN